MKKKRYSEEQIVRILQEAETGIPARDLCRKHNIAEQTFYRWKSKYGGMGVSEAKRLKRLEQENAELKKVVAELTLDNRMLRDINQKKW
jgi:putative transposase